MVSTCRMETKRSQAERNVKLLWACRLKPREYAGPRMGCQNPPKCGQAGEVHGCVRLSQGRGHDLESGRSGSLWGYLMDITLCPTFIHNGINVPHANMEGTPFALVLQAFLSFACEFEFQSKLSSGPFKSWFLTGETVINENPE